MERFKLVPFCSLGKKHGLIKVLSFQELCVYDGEMVKQDTEDIIYVEKDAGIYFWNRGISRDFPPRYFNIGFTLYTP